MNEPPTSSLPRGLVRGDDGALRCAWCNASPEYRAYHDHEWGFPVTDDRRLFEKLCLEGFQSGLSWLTILRKREAFRRAFAGFDFTVLAEWGEGQVRELLADAGIVRHRGKIEATLGNARRACALVAETGSLAGYVWSFEPPPASRPARLDWETLRSITTSEASHALSQDLRRRGWRFVGPTTAYAFLQAMGLVNDHVEGCSTRERALAARAALVVPGRAAAGDAADDEAAAAPGRAGSGSASGGPGRAGRGARRR
jgi:DNA-3-methyladenine glycosylase I